MIRAGLAGAGRWGQVLVRSVQGKSDKIRFTHCVTRTLSKAKDFAAETDLVLGDDYDALVSNPDIDAVVLATPHSQHFEQIVSAARAGKHIFAEKPLTLTGDTAKKAYQAADEAGVVLAVGHNRRALPAYRHLVSLIGDDGLGRILHVEGNFSGPSVFRQKKDGWRADRSESPAGGMTGMGVHITDMMIAIAGPPSSVSVSSKRQVLDFGMDDTTLVRIEFANGIMGSLTTMTATAQDWRLQVHGTKGWAELRNHRHFTLRLVDGDDVEKDFPETDIEKEILEWFVDTIETGKPFAVTSDEAIANTALLEKMSDAIEVQDRSTVRVFD